MRTLLLALGALLAFTAAAQTAAPLTGCAPLQVSFAPPAGDGGGPYEWTFGNGATSSEARPSTVFTAPGTYAVQLRRGAAGALVGTVDVEVLPSPTLELTADPARGCLPLAAELSVSTDLGGGVAVEEIRYAFGDGATAMGNPASRVYDSVGAYDVTVELRASARSCNATATFPRAVVVTPGPAVDFAIAPDPAVVCTAPATFQLRNLATGEGPLTYRWTFGNGDTSRAEQPESVSYLEAGDYLVTLAVTDSTGCERALSRRVTVGTPTADFDLPDTVCFGATYEVNALGAAAAYDFTFGPGVTVFEESGGFARVRFDEAGLVDVALSVTSAGCSGDTTRTLLVQRVDLGARSTPDETCEKAFAIDYAVVDLPGASATWRFDYDTTAATGASVAKAYRYEEGGEFGYNDRDSLVAAVTVTTAQGCTFDTTLIDYADVPNALYVPSALGGCVPLEVTFFDSVRAAGRAIASYTFDWGDGQTEAFTDSGPWQHTYEDPGEYFPTLAIATTDGCGDTSLAYRITVGELAGAAASFTADVASTCPGDVLTFTNTTPGSSDLRVHFAVEGGDATFCPNDDVYRHVITQPIDGDVDLRLYVDDRGCVDSSTTASYPYVGAPIARLDYRIDCDDPFEVSLFDSTFLGGAADSLVVVGTTAATASFRSATAIAALDSLVLRLPDRGGYRAVVSAQGAGAAAACPRSRDTVEFSVTVPVADFDLDPLLCANQPLDLDAGGSQDVNATCGIGYQWNFSFDRPYVTDEPAHMDVSGPAINTPQTITLIVDDVNGCRDTLEREARFFSVTPVATPDDDRICLPADVAFDLEVFSDTTIAEYTWDFAGVGTSTVPEPTFTFTQGQGVAAPILVTIEATDALGCPGSETIELEVYTPESTILTDPLPLLCEGESITFTATDFTAEGSRLLYDFDFGNGETGTSATQTVTYAAPGEYEATLVFTEDSTGCTGATSVTVDVQEAPTAAFSSDATDESSVCFPQIVTFADESTGPDPYTPIWLAGGLSASGETFAAGLERGTTAVTLIGVTSAGCADTASREVTLVGPDGDFAVPDRICVGDAVEFALRDTADVASFTFDFGDGTTATDVDPAVVTYDEFPPDGTRVVSLTLRSASGECDFAVVDTIDFFQVIAGFVVDDGGLAACGTDVSFAERGTQGEVFAYDFAGLGTSDERDPSFSFPGEGTYPVTLVASLADGSCRDTVRRDVEVLGPLTLDVDVETACRGEDAELFLDANREIASVVVDPFGAAREGRGGRFLAGPVERDVTVDVTATDVNGCEASVSDLDVVVVDAFEGAGDSTVIVRGATATLELDDAPAGLVYRWQDPTATGCADCPRPDVRPAETTRYILEVTDANGCSSSALVFTVVVLDAPVVPNLFTPNGDGRNDDWGPLLPEGALPAVETYRVYSRWGAVVFEGTDVAERWTGETASGEEAPSDVYAYVIELVYPGGQEFAVSGEVTLMR